MPKKKPKKIKVTSCLWREFFKWWKGHMQKEWKIGNLLKERIHRFHSTRFWSTVLGAGDLAAPLNKTAPSLMDLTFQKVITNPLI